jgi:hypothetical protein
MSLREDDHRAGLTRPTLPARSSSVTRSSSSESPDVYTETDQPGLSTRRDVLPEDISIKALPTIALNQDHSLIAHQRARCFARGQSPPDQDPGAQKTSDLDPPISSADHAPRPRIERAALGA